VGPHHTVTSAAREDFIVLSEKIINECGTSYEESGYKWGCASVLGQ
jgi:hypothetical protein